MKIDALKPYLFQFLGRVSPQLLGIVASSLIVRVAGISEFGEYALMLSLLTVAVGVMGSAVDTAYQRSCDAEGLVHVVSTKVIAGILVLPFSLLIAIWIGHSSIAILFIFFGVFLQQLTESLAVHYRIIECDSKSVFPRLLPIILFLILLAVVRPADIQHIALCFAISWSVALYYLYPHLAGIVKEISFTRSIATLKSAAPIWISLVLTQVYGGLDLYFIKFFHSEEIAGVYRLAYIFAGSIMPLAGVFSFIFLSRYSDAVKSGDVLNIKNALRRQLLIVFALSCTLLVFIFFMLPLFASLLYSDDGDKILLPAKILSVATVLNMCSMVYVYALLAMGHERLIARVTFAGAALYVLLALLVIPSYAAKGAALSMCITYACILILYYCFYKKFSSR